MAGGPVDPGELLLGRHVEYTDVYAPELLQPIPRQQGRDVLGNTGNQLPFCGEDVWHAYEVSWLAAPTGRPRIAAARLIVPATSSHLVESKSLKLYLNSVNNTLFRSDDTLRETLTRDISEAVGAPVELELLHCEDASLAGIAAPGECIDEAAYTAVEGEPHAGLLRSIGNDEVSEVLHSHLLRSLCPVTAQPDWATLVVDYTGPTLDRASLLQYVAAFRRHQEFHEQCVERIFLDIHKAIEPRRLSVQALYTRRGGLDICPWRSTESGTAPRYRLNRQ